MSENAFLGAWTIANVHGEVIWPFQLGSVLDVSATEEVDLLLVVVSAPEGGWRGTYEATYDAATDSATIERVEHEATFNTLVMRVAALEPDRRLLDGLWRQLDQPDTKGTWTGNEGGGGSEEERRAHAAQISV